MNGVKPIKPEVANLSVTTDGSVFWNDERMSDEQFAQRLQAFERVAQVMAAAQKSAVLELGFVIEPGGDRGEPKAPHETASTRPP